MPPRIDKYVLDIAFLCVLSFFAILGVQIACSPSPSPVLPDAASTSTSTSTSTSSSSTGSGMGGASAASCTDVCNHRLELHCKDLTTREGHGCPEICNNVQNSGVIKWDLACRAHAPTCAAIDTCP